MIARVCRHLSVTVFGIGLVVLAVASAAAQTRAAAWEIDFHGGIALVGVVSGTGIESFPVGEPILTTPNGPLSRAISSWFFGDGAALLNDASTALFKPTRIVPLDDTLRSAAGRASNGASVGVRVARRLGSRLSAEAAFDMASTPVQFTGDARRAVTATADSFETAWTGFLALPSTSNVHVASESAISDGSGGQATVTGALRVDVFARERYSVYVVAGAGGRFAYGDSPVATLQGAYDMSFGGGQFPMSERDEITVRIERDDRGGVALFGGGLDFASSSRGTWRVDARVLVGGTSGTVKVDATPFVAHGNPAFAISNFTPPSIQWSNDPVTTGRQSSLSGPALDGMETFSGGSTVLLNLSIGYVLRF